MLTDMPRQAGARRCYGCMRLNHLVSLYLCVGVGVYDVYLEFVDREQCFVTREKLQCIKFRREVLEAFISDLCVAAVG